MNKLKVLGGVAMLGLMVASTVFAAEFVAPEKDGNSNLTFPSSETHKNLYTAGGNVTVDSNITGDLFAAGGTITVNGNVEKDLFVGGANISLNGAVGDDLRVGGGNITINSAVGGDLLVGGGNVTITEKSTITGDLVIAGGNVIINSPVAGNVKICGGSVTINSKVAGTVEIVANKDLTFGPQSEVLGKIVYKGPHEAVVKDGAKVSVIDFTLMAKKSMGHKFAALITIATILKLLALFIAAWVVNRLFPGKFEALSNAANAKPWHYLGIGALALIATPIVAILLMITLLGMYLGIALLALYVLTLVITSLLAPYFVGALLVAWYHKSATLVLSWQGLIYGLLVMTIVGMIPFIGWLVAGIVYTICLGAIVVHTVKKETSVNL